MTTNWDLLTERTAVTQIKQFAEGRLSERAVTRSFTGTEYAGEFRKLVRSEGGTARARVLARKALKRRNIL